MKICDCGSKTFNASQRCYHDVVVDSNGTFIEDIGIFESENPYGPFTCTQCGKEYEELD